MRCCVAALWVSALTTLAVVAEESRPDAVPRPVENEVDLTDEEKRAWSNLHGGGGWGKRGWKDLNSAWGKRGWKDLNGAWGKRGWQDLNSAWGKRAWQDMRSAWGKRAWADMYQTPWGKRAWADMYQTPWGKRGWQDLNSAWGKRGWQDMSSAWGKRAPEKWANLNGFWGKKSGNEMDYPDFEPTVEQLLLLQQLEDERPELIEVEVPEKKAWSSLHSAWGKRPMKPAPMNSGSYYWKRQPGWTNLKGVWGKRSGESVALEEDIETNDGGTSQDDA